jgi:nitrite reductase/ring-hydroxylating ferredoxin subunit
MPTRIELCSTADIAPGTAIRVDAGGLELAVYNLDGEFYCTDDQCTHGPGFLSEGFVDGDVIECNFHNGQFNIKTGEVVAPPCMIPVKTYPVTVADGKVFIDA